ncbi:MAG: hypothetical protein KY469_21150 [Actinobacteria bacterium]|nr:hypothetical protein [Actinomycetota bacterium]
MTTQGRRTRRRTAGRRTTVGMLTLAVLVLAPAGAALAAPPEPGNASCMGYEASAVSPPGTSDEAPGGMPNVLSDIDTFFVDPDGEFHNRGKVIRVFTQLGADSHEACDEALIAAFFGG